MKIRRINYKRVSLVFLVLVFGVLLFKISASNKTNLVSSNTPNIPEKTDRITISFVGDILLAGNVENKINSSGINYPFEMVKDELSKADFTIANLENPVGVSGKPKANKKYTFRAKPKTLDGVVFSGIDILSLANNHILDYGKSAFEETLSNIKERELNYIGAGIDEDEAYAPYIAYKNGKRIAFFGASRVIPAVNWYAGKNYSGVAGVYNANKLIEEIKKFDSKDIVVVYLHWGEEREIFPNDILRGLARNLIDNGADIVVGTHPHVLQGFEYYKDKLIAYSLGNFVFTNHNNDSIILNTTFNLDGSMESAKIVPCKINYYRPMVIKGVEEKNKFNKMIEERSDGIKVDENGNLIKS